MVPDTFSMGTFSVNISSHVERQAREAPKQWALSVPLGGGAYDHLSYLSLWHEVRDVACGLKEYGIGPGSRTILMVPPSREFFVLTFALFQAGATPVLIDPGIGLKYLKQCIAEVAPSAFIGIPKAHLARLLFGWGRSTIGKLVTAGKRWGWSGETVPDLLVTGSKTKAFTPHQPASKELAAILFTSGSTGVPKGVEYTHEIFNAQVESLKSLFGIVPGEVDLCTFPLFALFAPALGMRAIVPEMDATRPARVDPDHIFGPIEEFGCTNLFGSPALLNRLVRAKQAQQIRLPTLKRILSAGAPVPPATLQQLTSMLAPGVQIYTPYGATESLPVAVIGSDEILSQTSQLTRQGAGTCIGRPASPVTVSIMPITDEAVATYELSSQLSANQIGEIVARGPVVTERYFERPLQTALAKMTDSTTGETLHRMGDVGYFDAEGRLWYCGRKSQRVVLPSGVTLYTDRLEGYFNSHPEVFRSALIGLGEDDARQAIVCIERERPGKLSRAALLKELRELAMSHEEARLISGFLFHPSFPVDIRHNSKIFREKLTQWATGRKVFGVR